LKAVFSYNGYRILVGTPQVKRPPGRKKSDGRVQLRVILKKYSGSKVSVHPVSLERVP
jgi:hypothetical protein